MTNRQKTVQFYFDVRSPYSFLAWTEIPGLEREFNLRIEPLPFAIELIDAFGAPDDRDERQIRKVKYLYMDARRLAAEKGLLIRGTVKIFDPLLAHSAFLYAKEQAEERNLFDCLLPRFWNRALDIEDLDSMRDVVASVDLDPNAFDVFVKKRAGPSLKAVAEAAHSAGVFGVPTFVLNDELFWGVDRIDLLKRRAGHQ